MIRGIKFACVPTRDQSRALKFYTEKLGFRVMTDQPFGAQRWIELGIPGAESQVVLFTPRRVSRSDWRISTARFLDR
jgi:catechol 2,3-dioxygenase-like lactoylglutathione lyase family enzyme